MVTEPAKMRLRTNTLEGDLDAVWYCDGSALLVRAGLRSFSRSSASKTCA